MPVKFPNRPMTSNTPNAMPKTPPASSGHMSDAVRPTQQSSLPSFAPAFSRRRTPNNSKE